MLMNNPMFLNQMDSFIIYAMLLQVVLFFVGAYFQYAVAKKLNHEYAWFAWIPILNLVQLLQLAGMSAWWILTFVLAFVPAVGFLVSFAWTLFIVYLIYKIAGKLNKPNWIAFVSLIPAFGYATSMILLDKMSNPSKDEDEQNNEDSSQTEDDMSDIADDDTDIQEDDYDNKEETEDR